MARDMRSIRPIRPTARGGSPPAPIPLNEYYLATAAGGGDDVNPGTEAQPWLTFAFAVTQLIPGDTLYIRAGTYNERLNIWYDGGGSFGLETTYCNYPLENPIIDGTGIPILHGEGLVHMQGVEYVRVTGLTVQNSTAAGIESMACDYIEIDHNSTYDTYNSGISAWLSTYVTISDNDIELACNGGTEECLKVDSSSYVEVTRNVVHDGADPSPLGGEGLNISNGCSHVDVHHNEVYNLIKLGIGSEAWTNEQTYVNIYDNISHDNLYGIISGSEQGGLNNGTKIFNNIVYNNSQAGLYIHIWGTGIGPSVDTEFINNTSYNNGYGIYILSAHVTNITIRNNIFSENTVQIAIAAGALAECVVDHNLYYIHDDGEPMGTDYQTGDPLFVNAGAANFHLGLGSPAISNASATLAPADDYDAVARPSGGGYDIGAFEYV